MEYSRMGEVDSGQPAVFHITHWKAGSMWVYGIMKQLAKERLVPVSGDRADLIKEALRPGGVYSPVYMGKSRFLDMVGDLPHRRIVVMRDLRDTLVSWYFSLRYSHPENAFVADQRTQLEGMSTEEGLISLIHGRLEHMRNLQRSWLGEEMLVRYEEMVVDEQGVYRRICRYAGFDQISDEALERIVNFNSFEDRTGRKRGEEDRSNHRRKGIVGDWCNHFTPAVIEAFKSKYGQHLVDTGYETNLDW
jgi:hypothetical protein